jgi:redox-sensitive bicupin YhaK (pirin superfamily)
MLDGYLDAGAAPVDIPLPAHWNAWIYLVDGTMSVGETGRLTAGHALCAGAMSRGGTLSCTTQSVAHFVVLAGPRIDEPVVQRGPFVFESEVSLAKAFADFQAGQFGKVVG